MHSQRLDLCSPLNFLTVQVIYGDSNRKINLPSLAFLSESSWILRVFMCVIQESHVMVRVTSHQLLASVLHKFLKFFPLMG